MKRLFLLTLLLIVAAALFSVITSNEMIPVRVGAHLNCQGQAVSIDEGIVYVWTDGRSGRRNLYAQLVSPSGEMLWEENGIMLDESNNIETNPSIIRSSDNNIYITYDSYGNNGSMGLKIIKMNPNGNILWKNNIYSSRCQTPAIFQVKLIADTNGGVYVVWIDDVSTSNKHLYVQHFSSNGNSNWDSNGLFLDTLANNMHFMPNYKYIDAVYTPENGLSIAYQSLSELKLASVSTENDIILEPLIVINSLSTPYNHFQIVLDYDNNLLFNATINTQDYQKNTILKKTDIDGNLIWENTYESQHNGFLLLLNDNSYIFATNQHYTGAYLNKILLKKIHTDGSLIWESEDTTFDNPNINYSVIEMFAEENAFVLFADINFDAQNFIAQKYNLNGDSQWDENGLIINEITYHSLSDLSVSKHNSDYFFGKVYHYDDSHFLKAQKITHNGELVFADSGVNIFEGLASKNDYFKSEIFASEDFRYFIWFDDRNFNHNKLYYQIIDSNNNIIMKANGQNLFPDLDLDMTDIFSAKLNPNGELLVVANALIDGYYVPYAQIVNFAGEILLGDSGLKIKEGENSAGMKSFISWKNNAWDVYWTDWNWDLYPFENPYKFMTQRIQNNQIIWGSSAKLITSFANLHKLIDFKSNYLFFSDSQNIIKVLLLDENSDIADNWDSAGRLLLEQNYLADLHIRLNSENMILIYSDYYSFTYSINVYDMEGELLIQSTLSDYNIDSIYDIYFSNSSLEILFYDFTGIILQKFNLSDDAITPSWDIPGIQISNAEYSYGAYLVKMYERSFVLYNKRNEFYINNIYASLINPDGSYEGLPAQEIISEEINNTFISVSKHNNDSISLQVLKSAKIYPFEYSDLYTAKINTSMFTSDTDETVHYSVKPIFNIGNYPNPFNPETKISFNLKDAGNVSIEIFNIKGQKIKNLTNETFSKGQNSVIWNGTNDKNNQVASGIYFYKISINNYKSTHKMMLIK